MGARALDQELIDRTRTLLREILEEDVDVAPDENLFKIGLMDSMLLVSLVERLEKELSITIEDREITPDYFLSLERISLFLRKKLSEAGRDPQGAAR